jgi:AMP phosphorylase
LNLEIEAGGNLIVVLSKSEAERLGVLSDDRLFVNINGSEVSTILNIAFDFPEGVIGVYREVMERLDLENGDTVSVRPAARPESLGFIREKISGERLTPWKMHKIVEDVVEHHLSSIELAAFVTALEIHGTNMEEVEALSRAMIQTGKTISFGKGPILDKHSIGGVPGDKTTLLVVPIVAAAGYIIPKSSSRAITSPAGTADRMETLAPVNLKIEKISKIVDDLGACIVWGGAIDLAPADDLFIRVEYPLSIDPLLLPSIISKKKAMGSTHIVVDIPSGIGTKIATINQAEQLAIKFKELGSRLDMDIECFISEGGQPIGRAVGPILEAKEALEALMGMGPPDLVNKALGIAGVLFEMVGESNGQGLAKEILDSGKALEKMREIIDAQGGDPNVNPIDLEIPNNWVDIEAELDGRVLGINNRAIARIAREAGAPGDKYAGILLHVKTGDQVSMGDPLLRIYGNSERKLANAEKLYRAEEPLLVSNRMGEKMLLKKIRGITPLSREFEFVR